MSGCVIDTPSVSLDVVGGVLEAAVNISADAGNEVSIHADGLYAPAGVPAGAVAMFAGAAAPSGWLLCDGSAVSRSTYAALFAVLGSTYGNGNGTTTFNVPDLRGRVPVGVGTHADVNARALTEGLGVSSRTPKHNSSDDITVTTDPHDHTISYPGFLINGGTVTGPDAEGSADAVFGGTTDAATVAAHKNGGVGPDNGPSGGRPTDMPAYVTFNGIIKT